MDDAVACEKKISTFIIVSVSVLCGFLLFPSIIGSLNTDRWALLLLAASSALIILASPAKLRAKRLDRIWQIGILCSAVLCIAIGVLFDVQKILIFAGVLLVFWLAGQTVNGTRKQYLFCFFCLCFFVPLPSGLETTVGTWLAHKEASMFVAFGQSLGMPIYQFGPQIVSGDTAVTVNSECSGTLLFSPALLGCLVVAATRNWSLRQSLLFTLSALPMAFVLNLLRFSILVGINFNAPEDVAAGFHDFLGWLVMPLVWLLPIVFFSAPTSLVLRTYYGNHNGRVILVGCAIGASLAVVINSLHHIPPPNSLIPFYLNGWVGREVTIPEGEARILAASSSTRRMYVNASGDRHILVTMMFHSDAEKSAQHTSKKCFEALGWRTSAHGSIKYAEGIVIEHMTVRNYNQVQAVAEVRISAPSLPSGMVNGVIRFQFVEMASVHRDARHRAIMQFLQAAEINMGKAA